ncbi:CDP-glycerol glycerophosphotransferase family protein [Ruminococcus albus]|uniref:CDP-glycerol glycerophosphotransferase, TagB/SpsB family n=1 Tax=Ruminococcus albus TaxID=1264 RepID=A0A1H7KSB0_RUMAL|nr:CDP-glycerol glycerophosphotransferase family protein [Ruminococcus albus]SEK88935.1 CDP-glycerol glycerophosphotransferase, TagB/SpsB family [Ruminococcus albus]
MNHDYIRKPIYMFLSLINCIVPKKKKIFIYGGDFLEDNSEAMLHYISKETHMKTVCVVNKVRKYNPKSHIKFKKNTYINAIIEMLTCTVMLDSSYHTIKMKPTQNQLFIQLWHGSPLKKLPPSSYISNGKYYSMFYYASDMFKEHLKYTFDVSDEQMVLCGHPRNDYLLFNNRRPDFLSTNVKNVIWLPTYRHGNGRSESDIDFPVLDSSNVNELNCLLKKLGIKLYIKPHRLQSKSINTVLESCEDSNIIVISDEYLIRKGIVLYQLLSHMDALLTDYSSVYFDYLLLDRPIGFVITDFDIYGDNRGFAFTDPLSLMPGIKIYDFDGLREFFMDLSESNDGYVKNRMVVNDACNFYKDGLNCKRTLKIIENFMKGN